jgi:hypothetical protein
MFSIASFSACHFTFMPIDLQWHRVDLDPEHRGRLVDQIDGFVRKEAIGDVAVRESPGGDDGAIGDAYTVVHLVTFLEAAEDRYGIFDARLRREDRLEAPLQRRIGLYVLAVLVQCGRADDAQMPAGEQRLHHVASVHRAFRRAGADNRVQLVDEYDVLALALGYFLEQSLEALLELAAILRASDHAGDIHLDELLVAQRLRHITVDDALGEPLHYRRLANAGLSDKHRVVLSTTRQHLDDPADLFIAPDHRIELAAPRHVRQVYRVTLDRLVLFLRVAVRHPVRAAHRLYRLQQPVSRCSQPLQQRTGCAGRPRDERQQQMLARDVLVAQLAGLFVGLVQDLAQLARRQNTRPALLAGQPLQRLAHLPVQLIGSDAHASQQRTRDSTLLVQ